MRSTSLLLILFTLLITNSVTAQNKVVDSLFTALDKANTTKKKVRLYNLIASEYTSIDPVKLEEYANKALELAKQSDDLKVEQTDSWLNLGNAGIMQSDYPKALKCFTNAQYILENLIAGQEEKDQRLYDDLASIYGSIGVVFSEQNNYSRALEYYFKSLTIYQETDQDYIVAILYNNMGIVYKSLKEYDRALEYFKKALTLQEDLEDYESVAITITNIGNIHLVRGNNAEALSYYKKAEETLQKYDNKRALGELYNSYGNYYIKENNTVKAEEYYKKALDIFNKIGEKYGASASLGYLGDLYADKGDKKQALQYLNQAVAYAAEIDVQEQVRDSEKKISELYEKSGEYKDALAHYKNYITAKDSINNAEHIKNMVREEMNYEMEMREAEQKTEAEKREAIYNEQDKRHRQQMLFAGIALVLLFIIAFVFYNRLQLKKTLTLQRDLAEYEQKALHLQMNPHFVFNCLGSISSFIVQNGKDSAIKYLSKFSKLMRLTLEYSKESLIPIDKEIEGLQNYLELEQLRFNQMFDFSISKDPNIEDDMAIPPLLLQPFVENAIIHGIIPKKEKGFITIDFKLESDKMICTVTDDGIGFSKSKKMKENSVTVHKSMALEITRKRLEVIQAFTSKTSQVEISELLNTKGEITGTKIILNLPIQYVSK